MNESFTVRFRRPQGRLRVLHADGSGITFDEPDPHARAMSVEFDARGAVSRMRFDHVRQVKGWGPYSFVLRYRVHDGGLRFTGVDAYSLPHGFFWCKVRVAGLAASGARVNFEIETDGDTGIVIDVTPDARRVALRGLDACDGLVARVIDVPGTLEGQSARAWLESAAPRATRKACLLNLLARTRVFPTAADPLLGGVLSVFRVLPDRVYVEIDPALHDRLAAMALDTQDQRVWAEGRPHHPIHLKLKEALPEPDGASFDLASFRGEGLHGVQIVTARHPTPGRRCYAELDIDAGNPYQDVVGFLVHMGELVDGKPTDHLDLWKRLNKGPTKPYLYYRVAT